MLHLQSSEYILKTYTIVIFNYLFPLEIFSAKMLLTIPNNDDKGTYNSAFSVKNFVN